MLPTDSIHVFLAFFHLGKENIQGIAQLWNVSSWCINESISILMTFIYYHIHWVFL